MSEFRMCEICAGKFELKTLCEPCRVNRNTIEGLEYKLAEMNASDMSVDRDLAAAATRILALEWVIVTQAQGSRKQV